MMHGPYTLLGGIGHPFRSQEPPIPEADAIVPTVELQVPPDFFPQAADPVSPWLQIGLGAVIGALITAFFVTLNEWLKSQREDRRKLLELDRADQRQWDSVILDTYVSIGTDLQHLHQLRWDLSTSTVKVDETGVRLPTWSRLTPEEQDEINQSRMESQTINQSKHGDVLEILGRLEAHAVRLNIIANAGTTAALGEVIEVVRSIASYLHDGLQDKHLWRRLRDPEKRLLYAVQANIRIVAK